MKRIRAKSSERAGFTLMEALIAASIFAMVSMMGATIFINISQSEKKTELENALYEDGRVIVEMLAREIRGGTIDYEEYYNKEVLESQFYGVHRGVYASRFYDPGFKLVGGIGVKGSNPEDLGAETYGGIVYSLSVDKNMGQNPYDAADAAAQASASAFCEGCVGEDTVLQDELYLISSDSKEKTIILKQQVGSNDFAVSLLKMEGVDLDKNGIFDIYTCSGVDNDLCEQANVVSGEFDHPGEPEDPNYASQLQNIYLAKDTDKEPFNLNTTAFTPISPLRSNVKELTFKIWPDEDPYRAFAEKDVQYQPNVTIILTLEPSEAEMENYPSDTPPEITIQTTVSTGAREKVISYPPTKDLSWIEDALNP